MRRERTTTRRVIRTNVYYADVAPRYEVDGADVFAGNTMSAYSAGTAKFYTDAAHAVLRVGKVTTKSTNKETAVKHVSKCRTT